MGDQRSGVLEVEPRARTAGDVGEIEKQAAKSLRNWSRNPGCKVDVVQEVFMRADGAGVGVGDQGREDWKASWQPRWGTRTFTPAVNEDVPGETDGAGINGWVCRGH